MTEMTNTSTTEAEATMRLAAVLTLDDRGARTTTDVFTGTSEWMPSGRVFGGQVLAQATMAAGRTLPDDRALHSIHASFLRPGDATRSISYAVARIHDGGSFSRRSVEAFQAGVPIFTMTASFQRTDDHALTHGRRMPPAIPDPSDVPSQLAAAVREPDTNAFLDSHRAFDVRRFALPPAPDGSPRHGSWMRATGPLPDAADFHRAALAYASDYAILTPALEHHGVDHHDPRLQMASLDHAMWWHADLRVDEWFLYVLESPAAGGGRGLSIGSIFTPDGVHCATVTQEGLIRWTP